MRRGSDTCENTSDYSFIDRLEWENHGQKYFSFSYIFSRSSVDGVTTACQVSVTDKFPQIHQAQLINTMLKGDFLIRTFTLEPWALVQFILIFIIQYLSWAHLSPLEDYQGLYHGWDIFWLINTRIGVYAFWCVNPAQVQVVVSFDGSLRGKQAFMLESILVGRSFVVMHFACRVQILPQMRT